METRSEIDGGRGRLWLAGEMTIYEANTLQTTLMDVLDQCQNLEVDLSGVTEIDTVGVQLLLLAKREAQARGRQFRLSQHSRAVVGVFEILNLSGLFGDPLVIPSAATA